MPQPSMNTSPSLIIFSVALNSEAADIMFNTLKKALQDGLLRQKVSQEEQSVISIVMGPYDEAVAVMSFLERRASRI